MTLKSRFFLVTVITTFLVAGAVIIANELTHSIHEKRFLETTINAKRSFWSNILEHSMDRMQSKVYGLTRDTRMRNALANFNLEEVARSVEPTFNRLHAEQIVTRLQVADKSGMIVVSYPNRYVGETRKTIVKTAIREGRIVRGIERDDDGELLAIVAIPLYQKYGKLVGVGIYAHNLIGVLLRFMENDASLAFIADQGDIVGLPVESNILPDVTDTVPPLGQDYYYVEKMHGRAYQVTILSVGDYRSKPVAHIVAYKDHTESFQEEQAANYTTYAIIIFILVASLIWLYWFVVMESTRLHNIDKITNRELALTNSRLQEALRVKSDFMASMSHELRTPLNSVIGFSGALLKGVDGPLNPDQKTSVQYVYSSGQHLLTLINDILDLSKIEAGRMVLNLETVDLTTLLHETVKSMEVIFRNKHLPLKLEIPEQIPIIYGDNTRIKQVVLNILSNAAKFTDKGQVIVRCSLVSHDDKRIPEDKREPSAGQTHWVLISVQDSGIGIDPVDHEKVFEEFRQLDSGAARKFSGTGLGMAISRRIVQLHGGHIWLQSKRGRGTTVSLTLPHIVESGHNENDDLGASETGAVLENRMAAYGGA
jgi:signal transduction histidine kinase